MDISSHYYCACTSSRPARSNSRPKLTCNSDLSGRYPVGIPVVFVRHPRGIRVASWLGSCRVVAAGGAGGDGPMDRCLDLLTIPDAFQ